MFHHPFGRFSVAAQHQVSVDVHQPRQDHSIQVQIRDVRSLGHLHLPLDTDSLYFVAPDYDDPSLKGLAPGAIEQAVRRNHGRG